MYRFDEEILGQLDILMTDIKIFDSELHRAYTGISNTQILENIKRADGMGVPMIIRTPIIPTVNDSVENVRLTAEFVRSLKNVKKYELLPYHPLGVSKARALGREMREFDLPSEKLMEELRVYADL